MINFNLEDLDCLPLVAAVVCICVIISVTIYQSEKTEREYIKNGFVREKVNGELLWVKKENKSCQKDLSTNTK